MAAERAPNVGEESSSLSVVLQQCNDIIAIQSSAIKKLHNQLKAIKADQELTLNELKKERQLHDDTKSQLEKEQEKNQLYETEIMVIKKQLVMEKKAFEKAFGLLNNRSFSQETISRPEELIKKITGLEALSGQQKEELEKRDRQLKSLQMKLVSKETAYNKEKEELEKQLRQKVYSANVRARKVNQT